MTRFAKFISDQRLDAKTIASQLKKSKAYILMLANGAQTPSLRLAWDIEKWSKGKVTMQSWCS